MPTKLPGKEKTPKFSDFDSFLAFSKSNGMKWLDWQKEVAKAYFENKETFLVCPRQNGKSELMIWLALFVFAVEGKSVYFSTYSQKSWRKMRNRINYEVEHHENIKKLVLTFLNGFVRSPLTNVKTGAVLTIDNRTETSATGDSYAVNFIDECQFITDEEMASIIPTMATKDSKVFYGGTSPAPKYDFFIKMWKKEQNKPYFFYYGIPSEKDIPATLTEEKALDLVAKTNPSYPGLLKKDSIVMEYKRLSKSDFIRERLGVIDDSTSNLFFNEDKLAENTFKNKDFNRAVLGIYAMGSKIAFSLADRDGDNFFIQPLGIYDATDNDILNYFIQRKNKIKEIKVTGTDYAIYDRYTKALGSLKYQILKAPQLYQRDQMVKDYYGENKLIVPEKKESWEFLLNIQYEQRKLTNHTIKDVMFSFDKESNAEYQAFANAVFGANNLEKKDNSKPKKIYKASW